MAYRADSADLPALRYDRAVGASVRRTPEGFLELSGYAVRPGILLYRNADGTTRRELVPRSTVADPEAVAALGRAVLVLGHPDAQRYPNAVTPANVAGFQVGDVGGARIDESGHLLVERVVVRRADAIAAVERGERGLSPGYLPDYDPTPGTDPEFGPYDGVQRRRTYNHLAIVPAGRGGPGVALHLDAAEDGEPMDPKLLALLAMAGIAADKAEAFVASLTPEAKAAMIALAGKVSTEVGDKKDAKDAGAAPPPAAPRMDSAAFLAAYNERQPLHTAALRAGMTEAEVAALQTPALRKALAIKTIPGIRADADDGFYAGALAAAAASAKGGSTYDGMSGGGQGGGGQRRHDSQDKGGAQTRRPSRFDEAFENARKRGGV